MSKKEIMPSGIYYIGDLCYVFNHEHWRNMLDRWSEETCVTETSSGEKCFITHVGSDGVYSSDDQKLFAVDSGTLGVVKFDCVDSIDALYNPNFYRVEGKFASCAEEFLSNRTIHIKQFDIPFVCERTPDAVTFGEIRISLR